MWYHKKCFISHSSSVSTGGRMPLSYSNITESNGFPCKSDCIDLTERDLSFFCTSQDNFFHFPYRLLRRLLVNSCSEIKMLGFQNMVSCSGTDFLLCQHKWEFNIQKNPTIFNILTYHTITYCNTSIFLECPYILVIYHSFLFFFFLCFKTFFNLSEC